MEGKSNEMLRSMGIVGKVNKKNEKEIFEKSKEILQIIENMDLEEKLAALTVAKTIASATFVYPLLHLSPGAEVTFTQKKGKEL